MLQEGKKIEKRKNIYYGLAFRFCREGNWQHWQILTTEGSLVPHFCHTIGGRSPQLYATAEEAESVKNKFIQKVNKAAEGVTSKEEFDEWKQNPSEEDFSFVMSLFCELDRKFNGKDSGFAIQVAEGL